MIFRIKLKRMLEQYGTALVESSTKAQAIRETNQKIKEGNYEALNDFIVEDENIANIQIEEHKRQYIPISKQLFILNAKESSVNQPDPIYVGIIVNISNITKKEVTLRSLDRVFVIGFTAEMEKAPERFSLQTWLEDHPELENRVREDCDILREEHNLDPNIFL